MLKTLAKFLIPTLLLIIFIFPFLTFAVDTSNLISVNGKIYQISNNTVLPYSGSSLTQEEIDNLNNQNIEPGTRLNINNGIDVLVQYDGSIFSTKLNASQFDNLYSINGVIYQNDSNSVPALNKAEMDYINHFKFTEKKPGETFDNNGTKYIVDSSSQIIPFNKNNLLKIDNQVYVTTDSGRVPYKGSALDAQTLSSLPEYTSNSRGGISPVNSNSNTTDSIRVAKGEDIQPTGLVPCNGVGKYKCDFNSFITLINNIINWIIGIALAIFTVTLIYAGFLYMMSGENTGKKEEAEEMMWNTLKGFLIILTAWLIVYTILNVLIPQNSDYRTTIFNFIGNGN